MTSHPPFWLRAGGCSALPAATGSMERKPIFTPGRFGFRPNHSRSGAKLEHAFHNFAQIIARRARLQSSWVGSPDPMKSMPDRSLMPSLTPSRYRQWRGAPRRGRRPSSSSSSTLLVDVLLMEVESGLHLAGIGVADLHRIAIERRHAEFGIVLANIAAAIDGCRQRG